MVFRESVTSQYEISNEVLQYLKELYDKNDYIFLNQNGNKLSRENTLASFKGMIKSSFLPTAITCASLRKTKIFNMNQNSTSVYELALLFHVKQDKICNVLNDAVFWANKRQIMKKDTIDIEPIENLEIRHDLSLIDDLITIDNDTKEHIKQIILRGI